MNNSPIVDVHAVAKDFYGYFHLSNPQPFSFLQNASP